MPVELHQAPLKNGWYRLYYAGRIKIGKSKDHPLTPKSKLTVHSNARDETIITAEQAVFFNHV